MALIVLTNGMQQADFRTDINAMMAEVYGLLNTQVNNVKTDVDYTLVLTDAGCNIDMSSAAAHVLTIPLNAAVAFPIGTVITATQAGISAFTVAFAGTIQKPASRTLSPSAQYETASLTKIATDTWRIICG